MQLQQQRSAPPARVVIGAGINTQDQTTPQIAVERMDSTEPANQAWAQQAAQNNADYDNVSQQQRDVMNTTQGTQQAAEPHLMTNGGVISPNFPVNEGVRGGNTQRLSPRQTWVPMPNQMVPQEEAGFTYAPAPPVADDFVLMDVIGGGCSTEQTTPANSAQGAFLQPARSIAIQHPTKPVVAYTAGCMIIVWDLVNDQKVNLMGHRHNVYALSFTPNGQSLLSVDFNRNAELYSNQAPEGEPALSASTIILWDWQRGNALQSADIPNASSLSEALIMSQNSSMDGASTQQRVSAGWGQQLPRSSQPCFMQIKFERSGSIFMVLQSSPVEVGGGYRVTVWGFNKQQVMEMISSMDLELQAPCIDLMFLPRNQSEILSAQRSAGQQSHSAQIFLHTKLPFVTAERQCIKIWEYFQGNASLKKRIHIKQPICSVQLAELTNFFLVLGENGKILILDSHGEFVSTVSREGIVYTRVATAHDKLLVGTNRGTVQVYHMASLQFINEIPYQLSFVERFSLNSTNKNVKQLDKLSLQKVGPPVTEISLTQNLRYMWLRYADGSFAQIDRTINDERRAISGYSCGHFETISGMQWLEPKSSLDVVSRPGGYFNLDAATYNGMEPTSLYEQGLTQNGASADMQFITCAHDLSVHLWRHYGDRWAFSYIDVAKSFDQSLSFQRKQCDRSTRELRLTAVAAYPRSNHFIVGDNKGFVRVFQLVNESAHLVQTHRLMTSLETRMEQGLGIFAGAQGNTAASRLQIRESQDEAFKNDEITQIYITRNELVAVVTFASGCISLYDIKNGFSLIGDAVDDDASHLNTQYGDSAAPIQAKIIETSNLTNAELGLSFRKDVFGQDESPFNMSLSASADINAARKNYGYLGASLAGSYGTSLKILYMAAPNQIALQLVDVKGSKLTRSKLSHYMISEGRIAGFDVHPNKDYLLITSTKGRIYLFRIDTGELRGTIKIPLNSSDCVVDPSGLYVVVKAPCYAAENTYNMAQDEHVQAREDRVGHFASNQKNYERNTVLMFEIGTGLPAAEISSVFEISAMRFSSNGRYLSLGSTNGSVAVWSMGNHLHQNVRQILEYMSQSADFWHNYPIFLPDYQQFDQLLRHQQENVANMPAPAVDPTLVMPPQKFQQLQQTPTRAAEQNQQQQVAYQPLRKASPEAMRAPMPAQGSPRAIDHAVKLLTAEQHRAAAQQHMYAADELQHQAARGRSSSPNAYQPLRHEGVQQPSPRVFMATRPNQQLPVHSLKGNEERFMRPVAVSQATATQRLLPQQSVQAMQNATARALREQRQAEIIANQRTLNTRLYGSHAQLPLPPQPVPIVLPPPAFYPEEYAMREPESMPQGGDLYFTNVSPVRAAEPAPRPGSARAPWAAAPQHYTNVQQAQYALLAPPEAQRPAQPMMSYKQHVAEAAEPVPFNRAQVLYNTTQRIPGQPVHHATVKGAESLQRHPGFEQFADVQAVQQRENERLQYGIQPFQAQETGAGIGATQSQQRLAAGTNAFDHSLNDRDPNLISMTPTQLMASAQPRGAPSGTERQQDRTTPATQLMGAGPLPPRPPSANRALPPQAPLTTAFNNEQTQQDILNSSAKNVISSGIRPDPADIDAEDGAPNNVAKENAAPVDAEGGEAGSLTNKLVQELDGMNKYLQGVRVPQAIKGVPAYTLKNLREEELANDMRVIQQQQIRVPLKQAPVNKMNLLYQAGAGNLHAVQPVQTPVAPQGAQWKSNFPLAGAVMGSGKDSAKNSSTYDIVDEVYQGIDEFEERLKI